MATVDPISVLDLPPALVRGLALQAEADAHRVCLFLDALGIHAAPERPVSFPAGLLLGLGAALRLRSWERAGLQPQSVGKLPSSHQALREVLLSASAPSPGDEIAPPGCLAQRVVAAFIDHFAWEGRVELSADVMLGDTDEDALLEALADFLWAHRPR
jgi:hypothetical protein